MDLTTLLKDLDGAVEKIHQIQANLTRFAVEESDVKLKNQSENLLCKWSLTRDDQTVKAEVGLHNSLDSMRMYPRSTTSISIFSDK